MLTTSTLLKISVALLLGLAIGMKNEQRLMDEGSSKALGIIGGFRTHSLLSLFGVIVGLLFMANMQIFAFLLTAFILLLVLIYYTEGAFKAGAFGVTDELSAIYAFVVGLLCITQPIPMKLTVALTIVVLVIITMKDSIRNMRYLVNKSELYGFLQFAITALVVLPFLPNHGYTLAELGVSTTLLETLHIPHAEQILNIVLINPFKTWFIVVFVSGLDLIGYLLSKIVSADKSRLLAASFGGFVSSTSTTVSLAIKSKAAVTENEQVGAYQSKDDESNSFVAAAIAANASSFIQVLILVAPISMIFFKRIFLPTIVLAIGGYLLAFVINRRNRKRFESRSLRVDKADQNHAHRISNELSEEEAKSIFRIAPALKFAAILTTVKLVTKVALVYLGSSGFLLTSMLAATTGIDAIMINLGELAKSGEIPLQLAFYTYMAANFVNLLSKVAYSFISGTRAFAYKFAFYIMLLFAISFAVGLWV